MSEIAEETATGGPPDSKARSGAHCGNAAALVASEVQDPEDGSSSEPSRSVDTLYYDGQCPLCASEIEALAVVRGEDLQLVDIHEGHNEAGSARAAVSDTPDPRSSEPTTDDLLRTLHLRRADGTWLTGADANVAAWESTRRGRLLTILRWPVVRFFVDIGYRVWALWRYRRLYGRQFDAERHAPRSPGH